jgi:hypothetical protein
MARRNVLVRRLVFWALLGGLMIGVVMAAVVVWIGQTPVGKGVSEYAAAPVSRGDTVAKARRDDLAKSITTLPGVDDVSGQLTPAHTDEHGARVVSLKVAMSASATARQVASVLDAAFEASLATGPEKFLKVPPTVLTLTSGDLRYSCVGGTASQAQTLVDLRDDAAVAASVITFSPAGNPATGDGIVTARSRDQVDAVRAEWSARLAAAFPVVEMWQFRY